MKGAARHGESYNPRNREFADTNTWAQIMRVFEESDESERGNWFINSIATHHSEAA